MSQRLIFCQALLCLFLSACADYAVDPPEYEQQANLMVFFTPGQALNVQAAITGLDIEMIDDPQRVSSSLYENGILVDQFSLDGSHVIAWSQTYRLKVVVDDTYTLNGRVILPDSIGAMVLDTTELAERVFGRDGQGYAAIKRVVVETRGMNDTVFLHEEQHSGGDPVEVLTNAKPYFALEPNKKDTLSFHTLLPSSSLDISYIDRNYVEFLRSAELTAATGELSPQPVSYSNVEGGAGLLAFYYPVRVE